MIEPKLRRRRSRFCKFEMENETRGWNSPESRVPSPHPLGADAKKTLVGGAVACEMEGAPASLVLGEAPVPRMVFR